MRLLCAFLTLNFWACGGLFPTVAADQEPESVRKIPALASAGPDREILRGALVRLRGDGTAVGSSSQLTVRWEQLEGQPVRLSSNLSLSPSFIAPLEEQPLRFRLTVDDGIWITEDEVVLYVSAAPSHTAPKIRAGADRNVEFGGPGEPQPDDLPDELPTGVTAEWTRVTPARSLAYDNNPIALAADLYRLDAVDDLGFGLAPDYLVLWRHDRQRIGDIAPLAALGGPQVVQPGELFVLDGRDSEDPNGDKLEFRWEQLRGEPLLPEMASERQLELTAPQRPQELVFRLFVRDPGLLESAPATLSIIVAPPAGSQQPQLEPPQTLRSHPGNRVWLDAMAMSPTPPPTDLLFRWQQLHGPPVELLDADKQVASFVSDTTATDGATYAFAVTAIAGSAWDEIGAVQSDTSVVVLDVVPATDNTPPAITTCVELIENGSLHHYLITAAVQDPEGDGISFFQAASPTALLFDQTDNPAMVPQLCSPNPSHGYRLGGEPRIFLIEAVVPSDLTPADVSLVACDALGDAVNGCGSEPVRVQ